MKTLGVCLLTALVLSPLTASALGNVGNDWNQPEFEYISWCDQNAVKTNDSNGQVKVLADCSSSGLTCELEKIMLGARPAIHAVCR